MSKTDCPVNQALVKLNYTLENNRLPHPRSHRVAEEIKTLVLDIAMGRAGEAHLPSIDKRVNDLNNFTDDPVGVDLAQWLTVHLSEHQEVFLSHIKSQNCATGDCDFLAPAPCQMACPAGIDVPTYVSLIGLGRDAEAIEVIRRDNPFPWVCGLVCTRPCEFMCVRGRIDTPVSIKFLKAFAAERALSWGAVPQPGASPGQRPQGLRYRCRSRRYERRLLPGAQRVFGAGFGSPAVCRRHDYGGYSALSPAA